MSKPYALGIIPCGKQKNATATTARTLYTSGGFVLTMRHAQQRCDRVIIMSARYGLLQLTDPVQWYEATIAALSVEDHQALIRLLRTQMPRYAGERTLSYLPAIYYETALFAVPTIANKWERPYKSLGMLKLWGQLSREIKEHDKNPASRGPLVPGIPRRRIAPRPDSSEG